jgi:hypothetical protein
MSRSYTPPLAPTWRNATALLFPPNIITKIERNSDLL